MIAAVVPVKALAASKTRLLGELDRASLERLSIAMLEDVIEALLPVEALDRVAVVTPDSGVADAARAAGADPLLRPDPGLNAAVENASSELVCDPGDGVLVVLGDVAGAASDDLRTLCGVAADLGPRAVVLAPSSDGGTAALLRIPYDVIPARFGRDSANRHREEASHAHVPYRELALPSLAIDVDRSEDVLAVLDSPAGARHTRDVLRELGFGTRG